MIAFRTEPISGVRMIHLDRIRFSRVIPFEQAKRLANGS